MKKWFLLICVLCTLECSTFSQCVICTKTASSLDDKAAKGMNSGIIYLALMPLGIIGFIGYKWWQRNKDTI